MIKLDFRFAIKDIIRKNGLSKTELGAVLKKARAVLKELSKKRAEGELGFANALKDREMTRETIALSRGYEGKIENVVVLGIGGSALGARTLARALLPEPLAQNPALEKRPRLLVLDNIDPDWLRDIFKIAFSGPSLFLVISKSGATAETGSQLLFLINQLKQVYGDDWKKYLVAVTDPEKGILRNFVRRHGLKSLPVPPKVGGRYSVLTPVGLLPAGLIGIDLNQLMRGALEMDQASFQPGKAPGLAELLAAIYFGFGRKGRKLLVMMPYSNKLSDFSEWFAQLWAESLGKKFSLAGKPVRAGTTPVRALGATDQHSQMQLYLEGPEDKLVTFLRVDNFSEPMVIPAPPVGLEDLKWLTGHSIAELINVELFATSASLAKEGQPSLTLSIPKLDAYHLGALFYIFELATVIAGGLWKINPFDQPGVELGKQYTSALMGRQGFEEKKKELDQFREKGKKYVWEKK